jgi:HNH endonuclease
MQEIPNRLLMGRIINPETSCWEWTGTVDSGGYAQISVNSTTRLAHRLSYELFKGPIPQGLDLDHLCRNLRCINPDHLEPVTAKENVHRSPIHNASKTHCPKGHEYTPDNIYWDSRHHGRKCRACTMARAKAQYFRRRSA